MSQSRLLGFNLCPRLLHPQGRRLHVPVDHVVPADLVAITDCDVCLDAIATIWYARPPRCKAAIDRHYMR